MAEARLFPRTIANPLALGFVGLACGSLLTGGFELGWVADGDRSQVGLLVILFAPSLQGLTSVLAFVAGDALPATAMGVLSATWAAIGADYLSTPPGSTSDALGTLLLPAAVALVLVALVAARSKPLPAVVVGTAAIRFGFVGIYQLSGAEVWRDAAGVVGTGLSALAVTAAAALLLQDQRYRSSRGASKRGGRGAA